MESNLNELEELFQLFKDKVEKYTQRTNSVLTEEIVSLNNIINDKEAAINKLLEENNSLQLKLENLISNRNCESNDRNDTLVEDSQELRKKDEIKEQYSPMENLNHPSNIIEVRDNVAKKEESSIITNLYNKYPILMGYVTVTVCPLHKVELINKQVQVFGRIVPLSPRKFGKKIVELSCCPKCNTAFISINDKEELERKSGMYEIKTTNFDKFKMLRARNNPLIKKVENDKKIRNSDIGNNLSSESYIHQLGYSVQLPREKRWEILLTKVLPNVEFEDVVKLINSQINMKSSINSKDYSNAIIEWKYDLGRLWELAL